MNKIYVLKYTIEFPNKSIEYRVEYFNFTQRQEFIKKYIECKEKYYITNLETFYANLEYVTVENMINSI
jgi:hypothetical protein